MNPSMDLERTWFEVRCSVIFGKFEVPFQRTNLSSEGSMFGFFMIREVRSSVSEDKPKFGRFNVRFFYDSGSSRFSIFRFIPSLIMGGNEIFVNLFSRKKNSDFLSRFHI